ncbi:hypothetical protein [endosymbiont GvMRE of Glomus versiforme]|uniref:hypothetical protein n=1 Tax=endosymbiont GvMRE of Glomus versiforme TaxID=2039283 RepID=UPI0011C4A311|nr:hypothetical protein [endosymbiont GvMRE of Glomus versiforme]
MDFLKDSEKLAEEAKHIIIKNGSTSKEQFKKDLTNLLTEKGTEALIMLFTNDKKLHLVRIFSFTTKKNV